MGVVRHTLRRSGNDAGDLLAPTVRIPASGRVSARSSRTTRFQATSGADQSSTRADPAVGVLPRPTRPPHAPPPGPPPFTPPPWPEQFRHNERQGTSNPSLSRRTGGE